MMRIILIDDEALIHTMWKSEAVKYNLDLFCFFTVEDFMNEKAKFKREDLIYIDSNLGAKLKGEDYAKAIFELGFENIFLTSAYTEIDLALHPWIKSIVSKRPNFSHYI